MNSPTPLGINLASQPFQNERARNAAWGVSCVGLALVLLTLSIAILRARVQAKDLRGDIERKQASLTITERESAGYSAVLGRRNNAEVFSRNVFLNEVIARRAVSWTLVFRDLEHLLPSNVRLIGVRLPQVTSEESAANSAKGTNRVQLDMSIATDRPDALIELLKRLATSKLFGSAKVLAQQPPNQNDPLYKFRLTVPYAQEL